MKYEYGVHSKDIVNQPEGVEGKESRVGYFQTQDYIRSSLRSISIVTRMKSKSKQPRMVNVKKVYDLTNLNWGL